jgi:hypothetical protein
MAPILFTLRTTKARNPVALPARMRKAGSHRKSASAVRQAAQRELRRSVSEAPPDWR